MKNLLILIPFVLLVACKTGPSPVVSEGIATGIDCAKESIAEIAKDNIINTELNLLSDNWKDLLKSDALKLGSDVVSCLVEYVVSRSKQDAPRASGDANTRVKIERGEEWLKSSSARFAKTLK
jgi:hypothetical protein